MGRLSLSDVMELAESTEYGGLRQLSTQTVAFLLSAIEALSNGDGWQWPLSPSDIVTIEELCDLASYELQEMQIMALPPIFSGFLTLAEIYATNTSADLALGWNTRKFDQLDYSYDVTWSPDLENPGHFLLEAGSYHVMGALSCYATGRAHSRVYDIDNDADLTFTTPARAQNSVGQVMNFNGIIYLEFATNLRIETYAQVAATSGIGLPINNGKPERYGSVTFLKLT